MKLMGIITDDKKTGYFTAFVKQYPKVLAQARTIDEVKLKLDKAWDNFTEYARHREIDYAEPSEY